MLRVTLKQKRSQTRNRNLNNKQEIKLFLTPFGFLRPKFLWLFKFNFLQDINDENGVEWPYADRRQELVSEDEYVYPMNEVIHVTPKVFIGHKLEHGTIQRTLDKCLLTDEEMKLGPVKWEEAWAAEDKIQLALDYEEDDEESAGETEDGDEN